MSWLAWKNDYRGAEKKLLDKLYKNIKAEIGESESFIDTTKIIGQLIYTRMRLVWNELGYRDKSTEEILQSIYNFDKKTAELLVNQILLFDKSEMSFPDKLSAYPKKTDLAAAFLDTLAPKSERKSKGFFITPPPIQTQLVQSLGMLETRTDKGLPSLIDHSAGCGSLFFVTLENYISLWPADITQRSTLLKNVLDNWCIIEREKELAAIISLQLLTLLAYEPKTIKQITKWPVYLSNAFDVNHCNKFTHSIGNPPYLGEKNAGKIISDALCRNKELKEVYQGKSDLSFLFLLHAINALAPNGKLSFLTPSYWPTADSAGLLRATIKKHCKVLAINKPASNVFSAPGVSVSIIVLQKRVKLDEATPAITADITAPWRSDENEQCEFILDTIEENSVTLGGSSGAFEIKAGIQTGADKVNKTHLATLGNSFKIGQGIFVLSEKEMQILKPKLNRKEQSLLMPLYKSPACGAYILHNKVSGWLIYLDGSVNINKLPAFKQHLKPFKKILENRRECKNKHMPWWRLHWPRRPEIFENPSLLVPQRAEQPRFALANNQSYSSVDVYHMYLKWDTALDYYGWLAILHSAPVHLWLKFRGKRKGKLLELYSTPLNKLPVPKEFSKASIKALNSLGKKCYAEMERLKNKSTTDRPWHLVWRDMQREGSNSSLKLIQMQCEIDQIMIKSFGLQKKYLKIIDEEIKNS